MASSERRSRSPAKGRRSRRSGGRGRGRSKSVGRKVLSRQTLTLEEFVKEQEEKPSVQEDIDSLTPVPVERNNSRNADDSPLNPSPSLDSHEDCNKASKKKAGTIFSRLGPPVSRVVHNDPPKSSSDLQYRGAPSRKELLATRVMTVKAFWDEMNDYGPNGFLARGRKLLPIAIVLNPRETLARYEENFQRWLRSRSISQSMVANDPEEERRLRQFFAYVRARASSYEDSSHRRRSRTRRLSGSPSRSKSRSRSPSRSSSYSRGTMNTLRRSSRSTSRRTSTSSQHRLRSLSRQQSRSPRHKRSLSSEPMQDNPLNVKRARVDESASPSPLPPLLPPKCPPVESKTVDDEVKCEISDTSGNLLQLVRKWAQQLTQQSTDVARNVRCCFQELERELDACTTDGKQDPTGCVVPTTSVDQAVTAIGTEYFTTKDISDDETLSERSVGSAMEEFTHPVQSSAVPPFGNQDAVSPNDLEEHLE